MRIAARALIWYVWPALNKPRCSLFKNISAVNQYLHYSYSTPTELALPFDLDAEKWLADSAESHEFMDNASLIGIGVQKFRAAMEKTFADSPNPPVHVTPISGGLDSRAILAWLRQNVDNSRIVCVTFGAPGTWDFEIGQLIANKAGVRSELIDLSQIEWKMENLVSFARLCERPLPIFEAYLFHVMRMMFGSESVYWSGFMGDPLAGSHLLSEDSGSWEQAQHSFAIRNRFSRSITVTPPGLSPIECLPASPLFSSGKLSYDEQLDFGIRQQSYIKPLVLLRGFTYRTPFLHPEWVDFILRVPRQWRVNQHLYKAILQTAYPDLFSLPTKANYGLPLNAPHWRKTIQINKLRYRALTRRFFPWLDLGVSPTTNYIDFDRGLRCRADLRQVVYESIQALQKRGIVDWLDMETIWQRHQKRQASHADALILLASLEIYLQAEESSA
jgi:hypothetical protein